MPKQELCPRCGSRSIYQDEFRLMCRECGFERYSPLEGGEAIKRAKKKKSTKGKK